MSLTKPWKTIYLLIHGVLFLFGVICIQTTWFDPLWPNEITDSVGASLIATGVAGWVLYLYVAQQASTVLLLNEVESAGITRVLQQRSTHIKPEYDKRFYRANQIDMLGIGLSAFREDYRNTLERILGHASIRILLLDPAAPVEGAAYSDQKDREEHNPEGQTRRDIEAFVAEFRSLQQQWPNRFQMRFYASIPGVNILRIDDEAFWGPYLAGRASRNTPAFIVRRGGYLFEALREHFDLVWEEARPV